MNTVKCKGCVHFDQQHKMVNGRMIDTWYGRCAVQSEYPATEQDGQVFPDGVARVEPGQLARVVIVPKDGVVKDCLLVIKKLP